MFGENNNPVTEEVTENVVEQTTEETVEPEKVYTEEEFNQRLDEALAKKIGRKEAKIRKEYEKKYSELENVLKAGTGKDDLGEITEQFTDFYTKRGVQIPEAPIYSERDVKVLAKAEAEEIISLGFEEARDEVNRLSDLGLDNMTPREKLVFQELATYCNAEQDKKELAKIGVSSDALNDANFIEFAKDLNPKLSLKEKYEKYLKYRPKKEVEVIGSMKNTEKEQTVKDFYTKEEALRFTKKDFDKNPALFKAVENSMYKWKK